MGFQRINELGQSDDIAGSANPSQNLAISEEPSGYGAAILGQTGTLAAFGSSGSSITVTGLTGMSDASVGRMLSFTGAFNSSNNSTFQIISYNSTSSVNINNSNGLIISPDANSGAISWIEREAYSLESDINYIRTDRKLIKGTTNYYDSLPTYTRPTDLSSNITSNLSNLKSTDAVSYNINKSLFGALVFTSNTYITINSMGALKHSDAINKTGIPCFDHAPFTGDWQSCYVHITDGYSTGSELKVTSGTYTGERIFGITYNGSSTSPDSLEIHFYSAPFYSDYTINNTPYTWESDQVSTINLLYGFNERLDILDINAFRAVPVLGILVDAPGSGGNADFSKLILNVDGSLVYTGDGVLTLKA